MLRAEEPKLFGEMELEACLLLMLEAVVLLLWWASGGWPTEGGM